MGMENSLKLKTPPDLLPLATGASLKIFELDGAAGMIMPVHYCTEEAVVSVKAGSSRLQFEDHAMILEKGESFLLPAGKTHSLTLLEDFQALVVMPVESDIKCKVSPHNTSL